MKSLATTIVMAGVLCGFVLVLGTSCKEKRVNRDEKSVKPLCSEVKSFDECEKVSHCRAIRINRVPNSPGPIWRCESKN
jgi:hypothetical protein